jgi:arginine decarboxylase
MIGRDAKSLSWWDTVNWERILALSNCVLAAGVVFAYFSYKAAETQEGQADRALYAQQTYNYINLWNSPEMMRQRRILARFLQQIEEKQMVRPMPGPSTCDPHEDALSLGYLKSLYQGPDPFPQVDDSAEYSAFEGVRTFFEELGAAYKGGILDDHTAFEAFSLPAETYWSVAVSGWLNDWLKAQDKRLVGADRTVGSEFAYFECAVEKREYQLQARPVPFEEVRLVLDQDANLPMDNAGEKESGNARSHEAAMFGPRIPTDYFVTKGAGESDEGIPPDPYETFSYDIALQKAGIEDFNVVPYTSVLPPEAKEMPLEQVKPTFHHGAVLEVIMAKNGGVKSQTVCAGIGRAWALDSTGNSVGGYAAEYQYTYGGPVAVALAEQEAKKQLTRSLNHELSIRGFNQDGSMKFDVTCLPIRRKYGMALAAIGFIKFVYPETERTRTSQ